LLQKLLLLLEIGMQACPHAPPPQGRQASTQEAAGRQAAHIARVTTRHLLGQYEWLSSGTSQQLMQ
jgi:hypothetical protein